MAPEIAREVLKDGEALALRAAELFLDSRPRILALAGGSTPRRTYEILSEKTYDWNELDVFQTDERWVSPGHPDSNWQMISKTLINKVDARGHPIDVSRSPEEAASLYEDELAGFVPLDFAFLGMGADGHTASLFSGDSACGAVNALVVATEREYAGHRRVTLTFNALNQVRHAVFLISGREKQSAFRRLIEGDDIPAALVKPIDKLTILSDSGSAD